MQSVLLLIESDLPCATAVVQAFAAKAPAWQLEVAGTLAHARQVLQTQAVAACVISYDVQDGIAFDIWDVLSELPSILCVNPGQEARAARGLKIGFHDYLVKDTDRGFVGALPGQLERAVAKDKEARRMREAAARLDLALRGADLGSWDLNLVSGATYINERWAGMLGYQAREIPPGLDGFNSLVHPEDLARVQAAGQAHLDGHSAVYACEFRMRHKAGHWVWVYSHGKVMARDEHGTPLRMLGTHMDITERKCSELALRDSEARFRSLTDLSSDWYWEQDEHYRFVRFEGFKPDKAGKSMHDSLGTKRWDWGALNLSEADWAAHRAVLDARQPFYDFEMCRNDASGQPYWISLSGAPIFDDDGRFTGYRGIGKEVTVRKLAQLQSQGYASQLSAILQAIPDLLLELDLDGVVHECHARRGEAPAFMPDNAVGRPLSEVLPAEAAEIVLQALDEAAAKGYCAGSQFVLQLPQGATWFELSVSKKAYTPEQGLRFIVLARDITERRQVDQALRQSEAFNRDVINSFKEHVAVLDGDGSVVSVNLAWRQWASGNPALHGNRDFVGKDYLQLCTQGSVYSNAADGAAALAGIRAVLAGEKTSYSMEYVVDYPHDKGWFELNVVPLKSSNRGVLVIHQDITQRKHDQQEIHRLAFHDALTGLPNRRLLVERLRHALMGSERRQQYGAIFFLDLDRFKLLNDTRGHETGDLLLKQVAERLCACVREIDTVARLGGDEFVVMLENLGEVASWAHAQARKVGEKICASLNQPYELDNLTHYSSASVGFTTFLGQARTVEEVLKQADTAMYEAKAAGRNAVVHFGEHDDLFGGQAAEL